MNKRNVWGGFATIFLTGIILYYIMGGTAFQWHVPMAYLGGDEISYAAEVKMMLDNNSWLKSDNIGAPFGTDRSGVISYYLFNDVHILSFLYVKLTGSVAMAVNLTYVTVILLNAIAAYCVMIHRKIDLYAAVLGAASFALLPYVFWRGTAHLMLCAYQCVPLTILLCIWIFEDEDLWKFNKDFFKYKKNILAVIFAFLIANNGIGYYPVFSCLLIMIAGISKSFKMKHWRGIKQAMCQIGAIVISMGVLLINCIICMLKAGSMDSGAVRQLVESELYSLKIARLFIPTWGTGFTPLDTKLNAYSGVAVYQFEITEYIGLLGTLGFAVLLIIFFCQINKNSKFSYLKLLSELNICLIFYATLGGFSVFVYIFLTDMVRCTNRVSVFIAFISIFSICVVITGLLQKLKHLNLSRAKRNIFVILSYMMFGVLFTISIYLQIRSVCLNNEKYADVFEQDREFVQEIESLVSDGAMIYQLPVHNYPDGGSKKNMFPNELFNPYLHSDSVKWSYGALVYEDSYQWNYYVSKIEDVQHMVNVLCCMGFQGIYINVRGYDPTELNLLIENLSGYLETEPICSKNGALLFYDLSAQYAKLRGSCSDEAWQEMYNVISKWR